MKSSKSFQGSVCLYQGEELGQSETEMEYHELTDPQGIQFWPADKGRDGCRTPMVWDSNSSNGGFSTANNTWLPIKEPQLLRAASSEDAKDIINAYRSLLKLRKEYPELITGTTRFIDCPEPILAFTRNDAVLCVFNLSKITVTYECPNLVTQLFAESVTIIGASLTIGPNGFAWLRLA